MHENLIAINHPRFIVKLMYAGLEQNMTGCAVYSEIGFGNKAYVHKDLWQKLANLVPWLEQNSRKIKIFDAYRPPSAHERLRDVIPQQGFFAASPEASPHCRATAVDVCLTDERGQELVYPTLVDAYAPNFAEDVRAGKSSGFFEYLKQARHDYIGASPQALENRDELKQVMERVGLKALPHEWWHYELPNGRDAEVYPLVAYPFD